MSMPELIKTGMPEDSQWIFHFRPNPAHVVAATGTCERRGVAKARLMRGISSNPRTAPSNRSILPVRIASFQNIATARKIEVPSTPTTKR